MESAIPAGSFWSIITIVGPLLLGLALAYAVIRNRRMTRAQNDLSERATRQNKLDAAIEEGADGAAERLSR
ncbi:hypothetical protein [Sphingomonas montanisoli]|uniref:Uncharacterized protein n=1 Tax=Sphingomonas montanisoli TaxID=2606412 RepID=A0A5D9C0R7_9SPHN|nr:hypothetical protein [Sphingomonas montanisoli]TZG24882.1 hypothetical protein FYJ91_16505 [Sphingomonas montanisoli]